MSNQEKSENNNSMLERNIQKEAYEKFQTDISTKLSSNNKISMANVSKMLPKSNTCFNLYEKEMDIDLEYPSLQLDNSHVLSGILISFIL